MDEPAPTLDRIFLAAIEIASVEERAAYIRRACGGDPELQGRVEKLVLAHFQAGSFLETPAGRRAAEEGSDSAASADTPVQAAPGHRDDAESVQPGTHIGPYRLLEEIGEGGMGTVWMAQQTEPVKRLVAVKLIKPGMDSRAVLARFEAERQALALMDHPNIAKVLDAGETPPACAGGSPRPYFVMELVKGIPITRYCDERRLTPRQRLELFVPVCHAIQHAHQKGVIHRDVKPSNVLVALYDDRPVVKVIDFGVAKATGQQFTEQSVHTGFGAVVGTVEYMSPEQASFNQLDVDARSDIYSLGVLLYELLTGSPPFTRKELEKAGLLEMLRVIREQEPTKPSTKLSTAEGLPALAANRGTEPAKLTKLVRGELDWIAMKALEKDRARRYETANGFAMDVQRYLADEPVQACPPSVGYRLRKFVRRNRVGVLAASGIVLALIAGTAAATLGLLRALDAERQASSDRDAKAKALVAESGARRRAEDHRKLAYDALDKIYLRLVEDELPRHPERLESYRRVLQEALAFYSELARQSADDPQSRAELALAHARAGTIANELQRSEEALQHIAQAASLLDLLAQENPADKVSLERLARAQAVSGNIYTKLGRFDDATRAYNDSLRAAGRFLQTSPSPGERASLLLKVHADRGNFFKHVGRLDLAEEAFLSVIKEAEGVVSDRSPPTLRHQLAVCRIGYAVLLMDTGHLEEADALFKKALSEYERLTKEYPSASEFQKLHGNCLLNQGVLFALHQRMDDAQRAMTRAKEVVERLAREYPAVPEFTASLIDIYTNLGSGFSPTVVADTKWLREALRLAEQSAKRFPDMPGFRLDLAMIRMNLGVSQELTGQWPDAENSYLKAIELGEELRARFPQVTEYRLRLARALRNLGGVQGKLRKDKEAEASLRQSIDLLRELATAHPRSVTYHLEHANSQQALANYLRSASRPGDAEKVQRDIIAGLSELRKGYPAAAKPWFELAWAHLSQGSFLYDLKQYPEAIEAFRRSEQTIRELINQGRNLPAYQELLAHTFLNRGDVYRSNKQFPEAEKAYHQAIELQERLIADDSKHPGHRSKMLLIFQHLMVSKSLAGRLEDASPELEEGIKIGEALVEVHDRMPEYKDRLIPLLDARAIIHLNRKQYPEAARDFERATELAESLVRDFRHNPKYVDLLKKLVLKTIGCAQRAQDDAVARKALERMLELEPEHALSLAALARILANSPDLKLRDPARAVQLAEKAVALAPQASGAQGTLGTAYYRLGKLREAIGPLEKAIQLRKVKKFTDSYDFYFLAMARWRLGEKGKAGQEYERAVKLAAELPAEEVEPHQKRLADLRAEAAGVLGLKP